MPDCELFMTIAGYSLLGDWDRNNSTGICLMPEIVARLIFLTKHKIKLERGNPGGYI